jgi:PTS system nitrogen regulatory IIA component
VRDTPTSAALVSLTRPLALDTPDGKPIRLAIILVSHEAGRRYLEVLGQIARLASRGLAAEIAPLREPRRILDRLRALEVV